MQTVKHCFKYIALFFITLAVLTGTLVLAAAIPQSAIKEKVRESAEYLCLSDPFIFIVDGVKGSEIDRYADSILLAIAYQYDAEKPLRSVMLSSYYSDRTKNETDNLLEAVTNEYAPNQQYLRYWHGSNAIVRPLLTVFNLKQIYVINGVVLALLTLWLTALLIRNKAYTPAVGVLVGLVATASWFVPLSLEYTWTYLLMLVISIVGVKSALRGKWGFIDALFLVSGMLTNYLDFLSTETITLTVPLLLILWFGAEKDGGFSGKNLIKTAGKAALAWGCGYIGIWVMKWLIASVVLCENVMPYVTAHIGERLGGDIGVGLVQYLSGAVWNNISCLFPFGYGIIGVLTSLALVLGAAYYGFVYRKENIDGKRISLYLFIGLVPYARYLVLHNHSYIHCFFTYRAQLATVLAIVMILRELTDWRLPAHGHTGKRKPLAVDHYAVS